jgi:hypothetical protein
MLTKWEKLMVNMQNIVLIFYINAFNLWIARISCVNHEVQVNDHCVLYFVKLCLKGHYCLQEK